MKVPKTNKKKRSNRFEGRRRVCLSKSNDSVVSPNIDVSPEDNNSQINSKVCNTNYFKGFNSSQQNAFGSVLDIDEEDDLDYEPSEVEVSYPTTSANHKEAITSPEQKLESNPKVTSRSQGASSTLSASNNLNPLYSPSISDSSYDCSVSKRSKISEYVDNSALGNVNNSVGSDKGHEVFNANDPIEELNEDHHSNSSITAKNNFNNSSVDFHGGLKITIKRNMKDSFHVVRDQNSNGTPEAKGTNLNNALKESPNVRIISITNVKPEKQLIADKSIIQSNDAMKTRQVNNDTIKNHCSTKLHVSTPKKEFDSVLRRSDDTPKALSDSSLFLSSQPKWKSQNVDCFLDSNEELYNIPVDFSRQQCSDLRNPYLHETTDVELGKQCPEILFQSPSRRLIVNGVHRKEEKNDKQEFINKWLIQSTEDNFIELLDSLCESYFTTGGCIDFKCTKTHSSEGIKKMIQGADIEEFNKLYRITLNKEVWFKCLFDVYLEYFTVASKASEMMLIDMIDDVYKVFDGTLTDKTCYVSKIIQGLQKIGFSFNDAVDYMILKYGTSQLWISDILLFVIAKEPNLEEHWCLVQKITRCRKEKVDNDVIMKLLMASFENYPPNRALCKKIYTDIFRKELVDLDKIPPHYANIINKMSGYEVECDIKEANVDFVSVCSYNPEDNQLDSFSVKIKQKTYTNEPFSITEHSKASSCSSRKTSINSTTCAGCSEKHKVKKYNFFNSPRIIHERVVKKFVDTLQEQNKPQVPANFIAHPSCQPCISSNFEYKISLHNLYPKVSCGPDILINDLRRLRIALKEIDSATFLDILKLYSDCYSLENFVLNVLTLMKSVRSTVTMYSIFVALLDDLGKNDQYYMNNTNVKVAVQVLAWNFIILFDFKGKPHLCKNILMKIKDWHNLVTSKIFLHKYATKSHMGCYIHIMKILISTEDYSWINEIFQVKALNLLGPSSMWPYQYKPSDVPSRNEVLKSFFENAISKNIFVVNDLMKYIVLMYDGSIDGFDLWGWFNKRICIMLEEVEANRSHLLFLTKAMMSRFHTFIDKYLLQAYMLQMLDCMQVEDALKIFKLCCMKGVYQNYSGNELVLYIKTNLTNFEIGCLLHCYFTNFKKGNATPHNFYIEIIMSQDESEELTLTQENFRVNRSIYKIFESVGLILQSNYNITINQPVQARIFISKTMLCRSLTNSFDENVIRII